MVVSWFWRMATRAPSTNEREGDRVDGRADETQRNRDNEQLLWRQVPGEFEDCGHEGLNARETSGPKENLVLAERIGDGAPGRVKQQNRQRL